jgi:CBS domain-containing protein
MQAEITIRDIVRSDVLCCAPGTSLAEAARRMTEANCSSILVEDAGRVVGIWTEHDALALDVADAEAYRTPISRAMSSPVKTIHLDTSIGEAALHFREADVRHLLVVDDGDGRCGIVSQSDIVINQGIEYFIALREVGAVFNRKHRVVPFDMPVNAAVSAMKQSGLDAIVVRCPQQGYGILTERDIVRLIGSGQRLVKSVSNWPAIRSSRSPSAPAFTMHASCSTSATSVIWASPATTANYWA